MHLAHMLPSTEVEAEKDEVEEEESECLLIQRTKPIVNIHIIKNTLTTLKVRGEEARDGPISPIVSVTTVRSMAIINGN